VIVSHGRTWEALTSEWHWLQAIPFYCGPSGHLIHVDEHGFPVARATQFLVGVAAHAVRVGHTHVIEDVSDLMGLMAIGGGREDVGLFFHNSPRMILRWTVSICELALRAGGGNVLRLIEEAGRCAAIWNVPVCRWRSSGPPTGPSSIALAVDALE